MKSWLTVPQDFIVNVCQVVDSPQGGRVLAIEDSGVEFSNVHFANTSCLTGRGMTWHNDPPKVQHATTLINNDSNQGVTSSDIIP